jgi:metallo-beta-lactamase class B
MSRGLLVCLVFAAFSALAIAQDAGGRENLGALSRATDSGQREAFQIFDNVYYVGINFVSAYLIPTSDGLVLIDSTYDRTVDHVVSGIEAMGFDPADIGYIFVTHWHDDHFGGAKRLQTMSGAKVGMVGPDWDALTDLGGIPEDAVVRIADGDTIEVGDTAFTFYHTPGHTLGTMSIVFDVRDGDAKYRAITFGGAGLNFRGVDRTEMYLKSVRRVQTFDGIDVSLPNHAMMANVFERAETLAEREDGEPHPFVAPDEVQAYWVELIENAEQKLAMEKARAGL